MTLLATKGKGPIIIRQIYACEHWDGDVVTKIKIYRSGLGKKYKWDLKKMDKVQKLVFRIEEIVSTL
jgi:hypothetical protein